VSYLLADPRYRSQRKENTMKKLSILLLVIGLFVGLTVPSFGAVAQNDLPTCNGGSAPDDDSSDGGN